MCEKLGRDGAQGKSWGRLSRHARHFGPCQRRRFDALQPPGRRATQAALTPAIADMDVKMLIARSRAALRQHLDALRAAHGPVALVPTMGALHEGHLSLINAARMEMSGMADRGTVVASIFVNPLQFGANEDLARYPRDEDGDRAKLVLAGCDLLWMPAVSDMYPAGDATLIDVAGPALGWEGDVRPGHFRGVATVVGKLFGQVRPDIACFGEKDFQQLQVVRRMVADLALGIRIVGVDTLREPDGLAMSSRNIFLNAAERKAAPELHLVLQSVRAALREGQACASVLAAARARLQDAGFAMDYLALVDATTLLPVDAVGSDARLIAAGRLGAVRLLDNIAA
jgi:pantoate--beta-alanine ligase